MRFRIITLIPRHTGDLGSITVTGNRRTGTSSTFEIEDTVVSLDPASNMFIGDRTIVIHADPDDGTTVSRNKRQYIYE